MIKLLAIVSSILIILLVPQHVGEQVFPISSFVWMGEPLSWKRWMVSITTVLVLGDGFRFAWIFYKTIVRDLMLIQKLVTTVTAILLSKLRDDSLTDVFERSVKRNPDKTMIIFSEGNTAQKMSFQEVDDLANQVSHFFDGSGFKKGDVLAFISENRLNFNSYWIGLGKVGIISAQINTNLRNEALLHTLAVSKCKGIIFTHETETAIAEILSELPEDCQFFKMDQDKVSHSELSKRTVLMPEELKKQPKSRISGKRVGFNDILCYFFTSGTTGLPKAAVIKNSRYLTIGYAMYNVIGLNRKDVVYTMLPMYHMSANGIATGPVIAYGLTVVTRKKFSASNYWRDCATHGVTAAQYIGEVARYLCLTKPTEYEKKHKVRLMFGNGLRPQFWDEVRTRFGVDIVEFYGATEGNCSMANYMNQKGAVGFKSLLFPFLLPFQLIKIDPETGDPFRNQHGLCQVCPVGEPGEIVSPITKGSPVRDFDGYVDKAASNKKILTDVFKKGDKCFRSGDFLEMDDLGYLYFVDRFGDTFRWKGENVSTTEVEAIITGLVGLKDLVVFGVEIPGNEGRACMVCIALPDTNLDMADLYSKMETKLPFYAMPVFIRTVKELELTTSYKLKKRDLQKVGYGVRQNVKPGDQVFVLDKRNKTYKPLTETLLKEIEDGRLQF